MGGQLELRAGGFMDKGSIRGFQGKHISIMEAGHLLQLREFTLTWIPHGNLPYNALSRVCWAVVCCPEDKLLAQLRQNN